MGQQIDVVKTLGGIVKTLWGIFPLPEMKDQERSESRDVDQLKRKLITFLMNKRYA